MNIIRTRRRTCSWTPNSGGWPAATIEAATRLASARRQGPSSYRFNFHKVSKGGWQTLRTMWIAIARTVSSFRLYEEADRLRSSMPARP